MCEVEVEGRRVFLLATHPVPPITMTLARKRDEQLEVVAQRLVGRSGPTLLVGDLNITMWCVPYRKLINTTGLFDARRGFGVIPTWPMIGPRLMQIPLDHCLHSSEFTVISCAAGQPFGSDHLPLIVELALPPEDSGEQ